MLDFKELETYSQKCLQEIKTALAAGNTVQAKLWRDMWSDAFIQHISTDFGVKMCCPDYIKKIAREITAVALPSYTVGP